MPLDRLPLAEIAPNPNQPRKLFRKDKLRVLHGAAGAILVQAVLTN